MANWTEIYFAIHPHFYTTILMDPINIEMDRISHRYVQENEEDNLCVRFIRKKFKCIVILLLFLITLIELLNNVVLKVDDNLFKTFISYMMSNNNITSTNSEIIS
jgi:hypothetical protein